MKEFKNRKIFEHQNLKKPTVLQDLIFGTRAECFQG